MNKDQKLLTVIKIPFILMLENKSIYKKTIGIIDYEYGFKEQGGGVELFFNEVSFSNNQLKKIPPLNKLKIMAFTNHFTDFTDFTQNQLKPYVNKMLELNQDTLHVGTVEQFKQKHAELFKMLTENDTISIRYLKNKNSGLGERIAIPANLVD